MERYLNGVPFRNSIDALAEARERRDQLVRCRMSKPAYLTSIVEHLTEALKDSSTPLGHLVDLLFECPIRDVFDLRAFESMKDGRRLGKSIVHLITEVSLRAYQTESDQIGF